MPLWIGLSIGVGPGIVHAEQRRSGGIELIDNEMGHAEVAKRGEKNHASSVPLRFLRGSACD